MFPLQRAVAEYGHPHSIIPATDISQFPSYAPVMPPSGIQRSPALERLLVAHAVEASYRQLHLHDLVGDLPWRFSATTQMLHFGSEHEFPATFAGTDNRAGDFRWAWAGTELAGRPSRSLRDAGGALGVTELTAPHVPSSGASSTRALAMAAAAAVDAPAFFCDFQRGFVLLLNGDGDQGLPETGEVGPAAETSRIVEAVWEAEEVLGEAIVDGVVAFAERRGGVLDKRENGRLRLSVPGASVIDIQLADDGRGLANVYCTDLDAF